MPLDVSRANLYRGKINLWVEDEVTRSYLATLWDDQDIFYLVGGGNEGVKAITHEAQNAGFRNVFAVIDRDMRSSNRPDWLNPSKTFAVFVLPVHEAENYLLDAAALAASPYNNRPLSPADIESFLEARADQLCWWVACCGVVAELKSRFRDGCIRNPSYPKVDQESAAIRHVLDDPWFQRLANEVARSTAADVRLLTAANYQQARDQWSDRRWRSEFPGKEILRHVGSQIVDWTKTKTKRVSPSFDSDLAKDVADWQKQNNAVPPELIDLRSALRARILRP